MLDVRVSPVLNPTCQGDRDQEDHPDHHRVLLKVLASVANIRYEQRYVDLKAPCTLSVRTSCAAPG